MAPTIKHCIESAVAQGHIDRAMADELNTLFLRFVDQFRAAYGDAEARRRAQAALAQRLQIEAVERKRSALLQAEKAEKLGREILAYRDAKGNVDPAQALVALLESHGEADHGLGTGSVEGRRKAILGAAHAEFEAALYEFRKSAVAGRRMNRARLENVVRELFGEDTGDQAAKGLAKSWDQVSNNLRLRYNEHGGNIGELKNWGLPQRHDGRALLKVGFEKWVEDIVPRLRDFHLQRDASGRMLMEEEHVEVLSRIYDNITTDGWIERDPTMAMRGKGALVRQHAESRVLHFKSADDWLWYQRHYGEGDPFAAMMGHLNVMARDIAAMEIMGPNPTATLEWLKQTVIKEAHRAARGFPAAFPQRTDAVAYANGRIKRAEEMWSHIRGAANTPVSTGWAGALAAVRDFATSTSMGAASISGLSDLGTQMMARRFAAQWQGSKALAGNRAWGFDLLLDVLKQMRTDNRRVAVRSGLILDSAAHVMGEQARYVGAVTGPQAVRYLADRTVTWTGLQPVTQMQKHSFGLWLMGEHADNMNSHWSATPMRRILERYGIRERDYIVIQRAQAYDLSPDGIGATILRPADIAGMDVKRVAAALNDAERARLWASLEAGAMLTKDEMAVYLGQKPAKVTPPEGGPSVPTDPPDVKVKRYLRDLAERYHESILQETHHAVIDSTVGSRSLILGDNQPGTLRGEALRTLSQLKSFPVAAAIFQFGRVAHEIQAGRPAAGATYGAGLLISMTLLGAAAMQLKGGLTRGEDPQSMDPANWRFWLGAMMQGGGLGIWGDFLSSSTNRFGGGPVATFSGPVLGRVGQVGDAIASNVRAKIDGKPTHVGRSATEIIGANVPIVSTAFFTRLAWQRAVVDQLHKILDPDAYRAFERKRQAAQKDRGVDLWWAPGDAAPRRGPRLDAVARPPR